MHTIPVAKLSDVTRDIWRSPVQDAVLDAGRKLLSLKMTRIVGIPDEHDAANLRADLEALWNIVDPVIAAIGDYAGACFGIDQDKIKEHFTDQLRGALEGNATFVLEQAAERAIEDRMEAAE